LLLESLITEPSTSSPQRRLTVLHVRTAVGAGGGADKTTLKSPFYLRNSSYRAAAAYLRGDQDAEFSQIRGRARQWRCPLFEVSDRGVLDISVVGKLYALCRRLEVRVWHSHEYKSNIIGLIVARWLGLKLVSTIHGWVELSPKLNFFYKLDLWALRRFDRVVVVSQDLYEYCLSKGFDKSRLRLIQNGIETQHYRRHCRPGAARQRYVREGATTHSSDHLVIGTLGRLSEEKGLHILIQAFAQISRTNSDIELWIGGEGKERTALEKLVERSGIGERVHFLGHISEPVELYECFDIFCLPSLREGLPNTVLEALAMEVPVIATAVGGVPAILHDGVDSRLVTPESSEALEAALRELIDDPDMRLRLAVSGRQLVEREFDFGVRMNKMIAVYDELFEAGAEHA